MFVIDYMSVCACSSHICAYRKIHENLQNQHSTAMKMKIATRTQIPIGIPIISPGEVSVSSSVLSIVIVTIKSIIYYVLS